MSKISLRANRLAVEFEGYVAARGTMLGLDPSQVHSVSVMDNGMPVEHEITTEKLSEAAKLLRERGEGMTLDRAQRLALQRELTSMPYGGLVSHTFPRIGDDDYVEGVTRSLAALRQALEGVSARNRDVEAERDELSRQRDAVRAFMGLDELRDEITGFVREELADVAAELKAGA